MNCLKCPMKLIKHYIAHNQPAYIYLRTNNFYKILYKTTPVYYDHLTLTYSHLLSFKPQFLLCQLLYPHQYLLYSSANMNERPISPITGQPFKVYNYFLQLILLKLNAKKSLEPREVVFEFSIYKDDNKFENTTDIPITLGSDRSYPLPNSKLNFVVINYNPGKPQQFALRISEQGKDRQKQIGQFIFDGSHFIDQFMQTQNGAFTLEGHLNDQFSVEMELYVDRSRYGLERLIRDVKNPKPKKKQDTEAPISHQRVLQKRKLELKEEDMGDNHHHIQKFNKFSPKRDQHGSQEKKKEQFMNKPNYIEEKNPAPIKVQRLETTKRNMEKQNSYSPKKTQPKPAEPQKSVIKTKTNSKEQSLKESEVKESRLKASNLTSKQESKSQVKSQKSQKAAPQKEDLLSKLPFNVKYIIPIIIVMLIGLYYAAFSGKSQIQQQPIFPKAEEIKKGVKGDKSNKKSKSSNKSKK